VGRGRRFEGLDMRSGLLALALLVLLPGCASRMAARDDDAECRSGGADRGTEAYSGCRSQLAVEREQVTTQYLQNQQMYEPTPAVNVPYQPTADAVTVVKFHL
jgi:hypothetical protein